MELLDSDLHRVLQSDQVLSEAHFKYFMHQLFCGVKFLHENRIIHRDLKVFVYLSYFLTFAITYLLTKNMYTNINAYIYTYMLLIHSNIMTTFYFVKIAWKSFGHSRLQTTNYRFRTR